MPGEIDKLLVDDPANSVFYKPFTYHLDQSHVPHSERQVVLPVIMLVHVGECRDECIYNYFRM